MKQEEFIKKYIEFKKTYLEVTKISGEYMDENEIIKLFEVWLKLLN